MIEQNKLLAIQALQQAKNAFQEGNCERARNFAMRAVRLDANLEDAWLILAALSKPQASLVYLKRALQVNPKSIQARKGIHWALRRQHSTPIRQPRKQETNPTQTQRIITPQKQSIIKFSQQPRRQSSFKRLNWGAAFASGFVIFVIFCLGAALWLVLSRSEIAKANQSSAPRPAGAFVKPSLTSTITPTTTFTATRTFTPSPLPTQTPTATFTSLPSPTQQPPPTETMQPAMDVHEQISGQDRWVEVNLSQQMVYVYEGEELVNSFLVSTGTWQYPTVTGEYRIYAKYRYADMAGPGYYLPNVPYTMYFFKGYALHGTYWHNSFGTPMSHGCINLTIADAAWLYEWADIGTLVSIHY